MDMRWVRYRVRQALGRASGQRLWLHLGTLGTMRRGEVADQKWSVSTSRYATCGASLQGNLVLSLADAEDAVDELIAAAGFERVTKYVTSVERDPQFWRSVASEAVVVVRTGMPG